MKNSTGTGLVFISVANFAEPLANANCGCTAQHGMIVTMVYGLLVGD